jgi:integrase
MLITGHKAMDSRELTTIATAADLANDAERSLRPELITTTRTYMDAARSENTRRSYRRAWAAFETWCAREGRRALPANPETVAAWMAWAAKGLDGGRPWARSSINQALSAIQLAHRTARHPFDRKDRIIAEAWDGISRTKAKSETVRQAQPITAAELHIMLEDLARAAGKLPADARDAALLALGWSAALRRSELVALDWEKVGTSTGYLRVDERGLVVVLAVSKGSQTEPVSVAVPRADMPAACTAVEAWAATAGLKAGEPVFRPIDKRQRVCAGRLTDRSVSRIIKARVRAYAIAAGRTEQAADELAERMSGHSMRAGYATAAAAANVPGYRIQQHTRHRSAEMVSRYVREADKWTKNGLKGVGF